MFAHSPSLPILRRARTFCVRCCAVEVLTMVALGVLVRDANADETLTGQQIYRAQCAVCHGAAGEGVDEHYPQPLAGDRSLLELTEYIDKSMPEDEPEKCVGEDAKNVAAYIFEAFYSAAAQARNQPVRVELSRLTVRQYQNAVADLIGGFRPVSRWDEQRGLRGEYFKSRRFNNGERMLDRRDGTVQFDFGETGPGPEPDKFEANAFSIRWEGSVLAPETGEYEFVVRTEHAVRLWVNDLNQNQPLIDAWVKSGSDTKYRGSIRLLAGRVYPLRLEFSKAKQGVDDSKNGKTPKPVKASIALAWKLPHQVDQIIPARNLSPHKGAEAFVVQTPFPPDDRSVGYERGSSISKAWDQATTEAAIEVAGYVDAHLRDMSGVALDAADAKERLRAFCHRFVERAFRRPLSDEQKQVFVERQFAEASEPRVAVKRVVLLALKSPRFLYREIGGPHDAYDVASRISFGLWDSLPDQPLLDAAAAGQLASREQVSQHAARMQTDLRFRTKLREFLLQWLKIEQVPDIAKNRELFPEFNETIVADLRTSLDLLLADAVGGEAADFRQLLLADSIYLNGRLAHFYGVDLPIDSPFQKIPLDAAQRAGVLSHPYLMAGFAYTATSSPIHRGVFISRSVLGRSLRPPPEAVAPLVPELHASLTTRERITLQTKPESCQSCHTLINPLGFTLEHFDAVGRYRIEEQGRPIDAAGSYRTRSGAAVQFAGVRELANFLSNSEETHSAFVRQLFHHLMKQPMRAFGSQTQSKLRQSFAEQQFNVRKLAVEIIAGAALDMRSDIP